MEIINFQCGHCGNLMGVSSECLGTQVRCPTCSQVVVAPAAPPSSMLPDSEPGHEHEDIFTPPESDDLFSAPAPPRLEMPPPAPNPTSLMSPTIPVPAPTAVELPPNNPFPASILESATVPTPEPFRDDPGGTGLFDDGAAASLPREPRLSGRRAPRRGSMWPIFVLLPLLSYAVLVTVALVLIYQRWQADKAKAASEQKPLDQLPDLQGDSPGVRRSGYTWEVKDEYSWPMPDRLKVALGQKLQVGDLEIQPLHVERTRVGVRVEKHPNVETMSHDSLVLHLRLRNCSSEYAFVPLDPWFDRGWPHRGAPPERPGDDEGPDALSRYQQASNEFWEHGKESPPLTVLEVGERRFFGSSSDWYERNDAASKNFRRAWVDGRKDDPQHPEYLKPGDSVDTFVSTDGRDPRLNEVLKTASDPLLYRIHVRRGLVTRTKGDKMPATAVIGVTFSTSDIHPPPT
jgi:hypothetical protein